MNSKVKTQTNKAKLGACLRISWCNNWLNLNLSLAGLSWPLYIDGQVSKNQSGSIQFNTNYNADYNMILYFDYDYT
jgi:hypothetical protein